MEIDTIVAKVKDSLLSQGTFPPCLFVEWDECNLVGIGVPQVEQMSFTDEKAFLHFMVGRDFARRVWKPKNKPKKGKKKQQQQQKKQGKITFLCKAFEAWSSSNGRYDRAYDDPGRKEALIIATCDPVTLVQQAYIYEMIRDRSGTLIDLLLVADPDVIGGGSMSGPFLPCFLAGCNTARQDMSEASHAFRRIMEAHARECRAFLRMHEERGNEDA